MIVSVFFFKQKTAYEMRISDWSSDVCSSDLPHSSYLNADSFGDMRVQTKGEFGGLGIEVTMENGFVKVVSPIDDTPAYRAGVKAGDYITHIEGEPILGLSLRSEEPPSELQSLMRISYAVFCLKQTTPTTTSTQ